MNLFFIFDEFTNVADNDAAKKLGDIVLDALYNSSNLTRALPLWEDYVHGIVQEAKERNAGYIRDIGSFIELRRKTIGAIICAALHRDPG